MNLKNYFLLFVFLNLVPIAAQNSLSEFVVERNLIAKRTMMMSESVEVVVFNNNDDTIASIVYTPIICKKKNKLKCITLERRDPNIKVIREGSWEALVGKNYQIFMNKSGDYYYFRNWKLSEDDFTKMSIGVAVWKWKWYD